MSERTGILKTGTRVKLGLASDEWLVACVRRGDTAAFEALYDRHVRELLGFCAYMLGSRQDAEDAVQATFTSAYRALRADSRPVALRPWLFTIARNDCLSILRRRKTVVELNGDVAGRGDPVDEVERREEIRRVFEGLRELPESQRAALVLAEVHGLSHREVGDVIGVRTGQVKAYVYQARSKLVAERAARDADCRQIREELAGARGAALLRGRLRRHVRTCPECRSYADGVARQRRQLGALLPIAPSLALKYRALESALGAGAGDPVAVAGGATVGATAAGTAFEFAGGGLNALACKVAVGMACVGASAGVGASMLGSAGEPVAGGAAATSVTAHGAALAAAASPLQTTSTERALRQAAGLPALETGAGAGGGSRGPAQAGAPQGGAGTAADDGAAKFTKSRGERVGGSSDQERQDHGSSRTSETAQQLERRAEAQRRLSTRERRLQIVEEHRRLRAERSPKAKGPPRSEEETIAKEEARKRREESNPEGASKAPKTEEELRVKREERERRKREQLEAEEARAHEGEAQSGP
jgi:RNA polymerase sigma factor (sigma-70 family)